MTPNHLWLQLSRLPFVRVRLWVVAAFLVFFLPIGDQILWRYVYGFINDLSPTTWIVFFIWLGFPHLFNAWARTELSLRRCLGLWLGMVLFYVLALGSGPFDPYALGYQPWMIFAVLTAWVLWRGRSAPGITLLLGFDLFIFALHGLASDNLWDYLFDPLLMIVLGISVLCRMVSRRKMRLQSTD
jgi:hypothetical protein